MIYMDIYTFIGIKSCLSTIYITICSNFILNIYLFYLVISIYLSMIYLSQVIHFHLGKSFLFL